MVRPQAQHVPGSELTPLERAGYLAHAQTKAYQRRLDEACKLIADHSEHAVCVSWGKDSLVLYHLTRERKAVHGRYRDEERFPDLDSVRNAFVPEHYTEQPVPGAWDMFERAGGFFFEPLTEMQKEASRWYHRVWAEKMLEATGRKVLLGLRRDESRNRARLVAMRGQMYSTKTQDVVLPLANWTGKDVWTYLCFHNIAYLHIYDASERVRARSDFTFGAGAASEAIYRHGAWHEWRTAYPEHFEGWLSRFPEMRHFI